MIYKKIFQDRVSEGRACSNLGIVFQLMGDHDAALKLHQVIICSLIRNCSLILKLHLQLISQNVTNDSVIFVNSRLEKSSTSFFHIDIVLKLHGVKCGRKCFPINKTIQFISGSSEHRSKCSRQGRNGKSFRKHRKRIFG